MVTKGIQPMTTAAMALSTYRWPQATMMKGEGGVEQGDQHVGAPGVCSLLRRMNRQSRPRVRLPHRARPAATRMGGSSANGLVHEDELGAPQQADRQQQQIATHLNLRCNSPAHSMQSATMPKMNCHHSTMVNIDGTALSRLDLNLLTVFDMLMQERNVTCAAERLHLSQSTVSHALAAAQCAG